LTDVVFAGDAAEANVEMIREVAGARVRQATESVAEAVARVAYLKWQHGLVEAASAVEAVYVRPAEAEVKRSLGLLGSKIARSRRAD
jgi:tRNA A37 threonylcarbamoyladenosine modification protein TsaB